MEQDFWHRKWENNEIAFHQGEANPMLVERFTALSLPQNARVFLPLCGKTRDIAWLFARGHRVVGVELSEIAIEQLFDDLALQPAVSSLGKLKRYSAEGIDVFVGDFFDLSQQAIGGVDAVYDRAALVALPTDMRKRYASRLAELTDRAPQLLICFEYDQSLLQGPPFSIGADEVGRLYAERYELSHLGSRDLPGGLKGVSPATETAWLLRA